MPYIPTRRRSRGRLPWPALVVAASLLPVGCAAPDQPSYQDAQGFRFTPPAGWVERARDSAPPARSAHKQQNYPLPPLGVVGASGQERLLVLYHRLNVGHLAWLRVSVADVPPATPLTACLPVAFPGPGGKRVSPAEDLTVSGLPAARIVFSGRWDDQEYLCETVAVRRGDSVYLLTATFPAADGAAREEVRAAVAGATWQ